MKQYFFQFSQGSYSDYSVGGLYMCDHEVTEAEWDAHYKIYVDACESLAKLIPSHPGHSYLADSSSQEYHKWRDFRMNNSPEKSFQKLHNMIEIEYTEMWRD